MTDTWPLLVLNVGSSSLKAGLYDRSGQQCAGRAVIAARGTGTEVEAHGVLAFVRSEVGTLPAGALPSAAIDRFLDALASTLPSRVDTVGHRVVHGGADYTAATVVSAAVLDALERLCPLAPGHQPFNLAAIGAVSRLWPECVQVACFDTAFHAAQPRLARLFALPRALSDEGIIRYGFHGLSYASVARRLPALIGARADGRVIVAHLGHGASLCAMQARRSVATTMGMTALDGLMMGRRSGSVDPGALLYMLRERGMDAGALAQMLQERSGLLGVSGLSDDVRVLEASSAPAAAEALALFAYRAGREIGSMAAALGGLDALVFTGGIGEHSARVRAAICRHAGWLGIELDEASNEARKPLISLASSLVSVAVMPADEEAEIARQTAQAAASAHA